MIVKALIRLRVEMSLLLSYLKGLLLPNSPGYLIQFLTHRCNANCGHCFDHQQRTEIGRQHELGLEQIERLSKQLGHVAHISLTGGEPFLRHDLAEIVTTYYRNAGVRSFSLHSNGSFPERIATVVRTILPQAPAARLTVTLSIDALENEHDQLRGMPGLYRKLAQSIEQLKQIRIDAPQLHIHACLTLTSNNRDSAPTTLKQLQTMGFDEIELNYLRSAPADSTIVPCRWEDYDQLRQQLKHNSSKTRWGLGRLFERIDHGLHRVVRHHQHPWPCGHCLAGKRLAVIRANGDVLPCEMLEQNQPHLAADYSDFVFGNLNDFDDNLSKLLSSPAHKKITNMIQETKCRCSFECAIFTTIAYRPWRLPLLWLKGGD